MFLLWLIYVHRICEKELGLAGRDFHKEAKGLKVERPCLFVTHKVTLVLSFQWITKLLASDRQTENVIIIATLQGHSVS